MNATVARADLELVEDGAGGAGADAAEVAYDVDVLDWRELAGWIVGGGWGAHAHRARRRARA
jgi:hypothetical protein